MFFPDRLNQLIEGSHATIILIGNNWMPDPGKPSDIKIKRDWVVEEIKRSNNAKIELPKADRYELKKRLLIPLFVDCNKSFSQFDLPNEIDFLRGLHSEQIDYAGWPSAIGPLIDRIAVKLSLKKRPDADEYPKPDVAKARTQPLSDDELTKTLKYDDFEGWYIDNFGNAEVRYLVKTFKFKGFNQAADFMKTVSDHCRILDHHPEWRNVFNHVSVYLTTWDAERRVTIYDLNLALYMNMAAKSLTK